MLATQTNSTDFSRCYWHLAIVLGLLCFPTLKADGSHSLVTCRLLLSLLLPTHPVSIASHSLKCTRMLGWEMHTLVWMLVLPTHASGFQALVCIVPSQGLGVSSIFRFPVTTQGGRKDVTISLWTRQERQDSSGKWPGLGSGSWSFADGLIRLYFKSCSPPVSLGYLKTNLSLGARRNTHLLQINASGAPRLWTDVKTGFVRVGYLFCFKLPPYLIYQIAYFLHLPLLAELDFLMFP